MFDQEFFPTPISIVKKMVDPFKQKSKYERYGVEIRDRIILEPSAGKGDLLEGIINETSGRDCDWEARTHDEIDIKNCKIYCIERDRELQHILRGKGYNVIAEDFLSFNSDLFFDLIIMNPPFSNGDQHLLKAWEIMHEGDIVCLLNSETLNNPYTERRKLLKHIVDTYGSVEELGNVFSDAERQTDVNVSLVRLKKVAEKCKLDFEFEEVTKEKKYKIDDSNIHDAPAVKDIIGNMLIQFDKVKEGFIEFMKIHEQLRHYGAPLIKNRSWGMDEGEEVKQIDIMEIAKNAIKEGSSKQMQFNHFSDQVRQQMWEVVFDHLNSITSFDIEKLMTHGVRTGWDSFMKSQGCMDFTRENVWNVIEMLFDNKTTILDRAVTDVFDIFTQYHKENRCHVEGWKTNDNWKVNRKIILPHWIKYGDYCNTIHLKEYGDKLGLSYHRHSEYSDIDKVMCYISGTPYECCNTLADSLERRFRILGNVKTGEKFDNTGESTFFRYKFWKKGTLHIEFKDQKLWEEFNMRACDGKNWLPDNEKNAWQERKNAEKMQTETGNLQLRLIA